MGGLNLWVSIAVASLWAFSLHIAHSSGKTAMEYEWNKDIIVRTNAVLKRESEHRATERQWAEAFRLNVDWYINEQGRIQDDYETTIAGIHNGTLVLRDRFRGCERRLSEATAPTGSTDGGSEGGLSPADQGFLVRIGARCDEIAATLTALQQHVRGTQ